MAAALLAESCDDDQDEGPTSVPTGVDVRAVSSELASQIDTRADLPQADAIDLAARFGKTAGRAPTTKPFAGEPVEGSTREFSVLRLTGDALSHDAAPDVVTVAATLMAITDHAYFYADNEIDADEDNVGEAASAFEDEVWPLVTGIFGEPASPGVDGDPRIIILQADLGGGVGGYVNGDDGFLRSVFPLSNEAEMIYLDRTLRPGGDLYDAVLAHELQHLIHERNDDDEEAWVNEGLSEAALLLTGSVSGGLRRFASSPETQLNYWPSAWTSAHYGAGAAFLTYVAQRAGGEAQLGALARGVADGPSGVDDFLSSINSPLRFSDVFKDWIVANIADVEDGPYAYPLDMEATVQYEMAPSDDVEGAAHQFGTDYYGLAGVYDGQGYTVRFDGSTAVEVLPASAGAESDVLWSNKGDAIDTKLTYAVDLTEAEDPALTFSAWYDIEPWYDFGYVAVSTDAGSTWRAVEGEHTSEDDPVQVALGPGYYGRSGGGEESEWVRERIGLSPYVGSRVLVRFEYVTDGSTHGAGWAVDGVALEGVGDVAMGPASLEGWIRVHAALPQEWIVRLILEREDGSIEVMDVNLQDGAGELSFLSAGIADAVIAVAGATEGTSNLAPYRISLSRSDAP